MARALRLAQRGLNTTQPNPRVGCVLVLGGEVVGEGWHQRAGEPHAEVFALRDAGTRARGATAYVTLEPCCHRGRTPPCTEALVAAGVARVVVAAGDSNPRINGGGIERLRAAGIAVDCGLLREPARELNIGFFSRIERGRPWLRLKLAMSLDGRTALASGDSKWITGEAARADVQRWRARSSALLSSDATVLADDPRLTVRLPQGEDFTPPLRVLLDPRLRIPATARALDGQAPSVLLHAQGAAPAKPLADVEKVEIAGHGDPLDLEAVLCWLAERGANEVQVEAGARLGGALFAAGLVDELLLYLAPVLLGDAARPLLALPPLSTMAARWRLRTVERRIIGDDIRLRLRPRPEAES